MGSIRRLPPEVVNKIAAGEVVERPASVVKELLENAVDAGATRVDVALVAGGSELVCVVDNGCGIAADELELAVANHSTSKIRSADDLFHVRTLGFRGEALAAIASVSRLLIRSRPPAALEGAELYLVGGQKQWLRPCGCPSGTYVEVRDLFFNTPVRRRFLRGVNTELAHVTEAVIRIALGYPQLHITLSHNERSLFDLPAVSTPLERIAAIFGRPLAERLLPVESTQGPIRLWGFVGHPQDCKTTNRYQYLFINGRFFRDRALQHALAEAYRGLLTAGRYPVAFIWLEMPPELVDVNVHPTKLEVRFHDGARLYGQLLSTLRSRFLSPEIGTHLVTPQGDVDEDLAPTEAGAVDPSRQRIVDWAQGKLRSWLPPEPVASVPLGEAPPRLSPAAVDEKGLALGPDRPFSCVHTTELAGRASAQPDASWTAETTGTEKAEKSHSPSDQPAGGAAAGGRSPASPTFGQLFTLSPSEKTALPPKAIQVMDSFLVTEGPEGILLIDQHALHEKILTLQLLEQLNRGRVIAQNLAIPEPVDLRPEEAAALVEHRELLAQLGVELEPFGGGTVLVQAYPALLKPAHLAELLQEIAHTLQQSGELPDRPALLERLVASIACKAAVKAGEPLAPEEISSLLAYCDLVKETLYCPHGRPAVLVLSRKELERYFRRG